MAINNLGNLSDTVVNPNIVEYNRLVLTELRLITELLAVIAGPSYADELDTRRNDIQTQISADNPLI